MTEERRLVTVLFADVVESTALGEHLDAEEVRSLLSRYFEAAQQVLTGYGGTLEKFIGDAVVGVFGIPQAHGDDPRRAIDAAIELRDRLRADQQLDGLEIRFGLATGEVVTTRGGGADFFIGDAVNVASRLQQAADAWQILAGERTVRSCPGVFDVGPLLHLEVKGKAGPVDAHEVRGRADGRRQARRGQRPFRGRQDELEELQVFARRAFRERRPAVASVIAPAGTGKSRLVEEFLRREVPSLAAVPRVATAQCLPYGQHLTYWPLRQMLFEITGIAEDASSTDVRATIAEWIGDQRMADLLAVSIGAGEGDAPDRMAVFAAWRTAIERASRDQPLILLFEDLHWSSESLLDLVEFVMQPRGDAAVLMLALARPELIDRRPGWGGGRRNFLNLFLEPLGEAEIRSLVAELLPERPDGRVEQIVAQSEGNPFYAEELVRSVLEHGAGGGLPDTVQATVLARLDLLPERERRVIQLGSIFGRSFRKSGIAALAPQLAEIDDAFERLLGADLVRPTSEDGFEFRHILIREVAYQTLTRAERARLHAAAAQWIASRAAGREDAVAEIVAFHFRESLAMLGRQPDARVNEAAIKHEAVIWLRRAADVAAAAGATMEASRHVRAAIELASTEQLPELYERLGDIEQLRTGSVEAYRRALELCRSLGRPPDQQLRVLAGLLLCVQRWWEGVGRMERPELEALREEGHRLAEVVTDRRALSRFLAADAFYPWHMNRQQLPLPANAAAMAEASARRAVELAEQEGEVNAWSAALDALASCAAERLDWHAELEASRRRLTRQADLNQAERRDAYHMVFDSAMSLGDLSLAERVLAEAIALDWSPQSPEAVAMFTDRLCVLTLLGRWDEALTLADRAAKQWLQTRGGSGPASYGFICAYELALARRATDLAELLRETLHQIATDLVSGPYLLAIADRNWEEIERLMLTRFAFGQGGEGKIERPLATFVDRRIPMRPETINALVQRGVQRRQPLLEAQARRAAGQFERAIEIWEASGAIPYVARARIELARAGGRNPDPADVTTLQKLKDVEYLEIHGFGVEAG